MKNMKKKADITEKFRDIFRQTAKKKDNKNIYINNCENSENRHYLLRIFLQIRQNFLKIFT